MGTLFWVCLWIVGAGALAYHRVSLMTASICAVVALLFTTFFSDISFLALLLLWAIVTPIVVLMNHTELRKKYLTNPAYEFMQKSLPGLSDTEKQALDAGTVSWDGELFRGQPDWQNRLKVPAPSLTAEEKAFMDGHVKAVCE